MPPPPAARPPVCCCCDSLPLLTAPLRSLPVCGHPRGHHSRGVAAGPFLAALRLAATEQVALVGTCGQQAETLALAAVKGGGSDEHMATDVGGGGG